MTNAHIFLRIWYQRYTVIHTVTTGPQNIHENLFSIHFPYNWDNSYRQ